MITDAERRLFDRLLDAIVAALPERLHALLEEVPLIVEDRPGRALLEEMDIDPRRTDLCGLHQGIALTDKSVEHSAVLPDRMMLFREPIMRLAGWRIGRDGQLDRRDLTDAVHEQIEITLLHEIGHHFGLDEDDLERLGYG